MKKCYNCGKELPDNAKFCVYCGQADERKGNSQKGNIVAWCLVAVLAVAVVGIMIVAIKLNDKLFWEGYPSNKKYNYVQKQTVTQSQSGKETEFTKKEEQETLLSRDKSTYTGDITYEMLARTPDMYINSPIKYTGTITQIVGYDDEYDCFRMNVDDNLDYNLLVVYPKNIIDFNLLVDDNVTVYGGFMGMYTYETVLGNEISVPCVQAVMMDYNEKSATINILVELPGCPATVNKYNWKNEISSTVRIDKIVAKYDKNLDGTYDITFNLTGEKTFGDEGYAYISYKLYDSENYIVDSGTFMTDKLSSGDKFKDMEETIYNLKSGTYRLEILDYR